MRRLIRIFVLASLAQGARADTPALLLPPSLARPDLAWISGRVLEERQGRHGPPAIRSARALSVGNLVGAQVEVTFLGRSARTTSGHDGEFEIAIAAAPGAPFATGAQRAAVRVAGASAEAVVYVVPPEAPFLLVSDLDDTLAVTNATSVRGVLHSTFAEDAETQPAVGGMAAFYRCLLEGHAAPPPVAVVSGSPVQLAARVERFLAKNGFPPAALFLRNLGPRTLSGYKEPVLAELAERFSQPFVLVGDSGERDPEIYAAFARANPGRVLATYVRQATANPGAAARFDELQLFTDPAAAARDAARLGLAAPGCVERAFPSATRPAPAPADRSRQGGARSTPAPPPRAPPAGLGPSRSLPAASVAGTLPPGASMNPIVLSILLAAPAGGHGFALTSPEVHEGKPLAAAQVHDGFGCKGGDLSPAIAWRDPPAGTRSFAVTVYDPDAPTGSGWWHWLAYDIPAAETGLPAGAGGRASLPAGAKQGRNDFGARAFGGACPPAGDKPHRYVFTVFALKVERLDVPEDASAALIGFMLNANSLAKASITGLYSR